MTVWRGRKVVWHRLESIVHQTNFKNTKFSGLALITWQPCVTFSVFYDERVLGEGWHLKILKVVWHWLQSISAKLVKFQKQQIQWFGMYYMNLSTLCNIQCLLCWKSPGGRSLWGLVTSIQPQDVSPPLWNLLSDQWTSCSKILNHASFPPHQIMGYSGYGSAGEAVHGPGCLAN